MINKNRDPNKTLVLNSGYIPTQIIDSTRAFVVFYKGNADVVANHPDHYFSTPTTKHEYPKPSIIRVNKWINVNNNGVPLSRENIYKRDEFCCVYCGYYGGKAGKNLTLDHVFPRSKGGEHTWENVVTACKNCNSEKADLLIEEWGREHPNPKRPHYLLMLKKNAVSIIPEEWKPFLFY
jgi:hypothetical protein